MKLWPDKKNKKTKAVSRSSSSCSSSSSECIANDNNQDSESKQQNNRDDDGEIEDLQGSHNVGGHNQFMRMTRKSTLKIHQDAAGRLANLHKLPETDDDDAASRKTSRTLGMWSTGQSSASTARDTDKEDDSDEDAEEKKRRKSKAKKFKMQVKSSKDLGLDELSWGSKSSSEESSRVDSDKIDPAHVELARSDLEIGFVKSYAGQLIKATAHIEALEEADHKIDWRVMREESWRQWAKKKDGEEPQFATGKRMWAGPHLFLLPSWLQSLMHELILPIVAIQVLVLVSLSTQIDWKARYQDPVWQLPNYVASRLPTEPSWWRVQQRVRLTALLYGLVYLPAVMLHFNYVLDQVPEETPLEQARKAIRAQRLRMSVRQMSRRWTKDYQFDSIHRPRLRQWATLLLIALAIGVGTMLVYVIFFDCGYPATWWRQRMAVWLRQKQLIYTETSHKMLYEPKPRLVAGMRPGWPLLLPETSIKEREAINDMDVIQTMLECCGVENYTDWEVVKVRLSKSGKGQEPSILSLNIHLLYITDHTHRVPKYPQYITPFSCCTRERASRSTCQHLGIVKPSEVYQRGCVEPMVGYILSPWNARVGAIFTLLLILMAIQLVFYMSRIQPLLAIPQLCDRAQVRTGFKASKEQQLAKQAEHRARIMSLIPGWRAEGPAEGSTEEDGQSTKGKSFKRKAGQESMDEFEDEEDIQRRYWKEFGLKFRGRPYYRGLIVVRTRELFREFTRQGRQQ